MHSYRAHFQHHLLDSNSSRTFNINDADSFTDAESLPTLVKIKSTTQLYASQVQMWVYRACLSYPVMSFLSEVIKV